MKPRNLIVYTTLLLASFTFFNPAAKAEGDVTFTITPVVTMSHLEPETLFDKGAIGYGAEMTSSIKKGKFLPLETGGSTSIIHYKDGFNTGGEIFQIQLTSFVRPNPHIRLGIGMMYSRYSVEIPPTLNRRDDLAFIAELQGNLFTASSVGLALNAKWVKGLRGIEAVTETYARGLLFSVGLRIGRLE